MITDVAYLGKKHEDIVNENQPIIITAAGHYLVNNSYRITTNRRLGRKDYQLLYIAEGEAQFYFNGKEKIVKKGNMILFTPNEPQIYYLYSKNLPETYWVHFTGYEAQKLMDKYALPQNTITYIGKSEDYQWLFGQMIRELRNKRKDYQKMLEFQLNQLLLTIVRGIEAQKITRLQTVSEIERAIHYFTQNYNKNIVIEEYTKEHFIKPCWFINNFKLATGFTPMQYVLLLRIKKAKKLLETTTFNVSQIAAEVGYANPLYFSRLFSKHTGMSPTEYKKINRTN